MGLREGEYPVPRDTLVDALRELGCQVDSHGEADSFPFGARFAADYDIRLSLAHERDVAHIAFHQYHRKPHERWFQDFTALRARLDPAGMFAGPYLDRVLRQAGAAR
ncbi:D-arabinono-1,4-lactone oxidase [Streptomyces sp. AC512_CC834]|uniref:D-arabinono-1,4-lactone oxidase n=1 Tax=Streptomyces sp. AC512_CC834 TaxID=2823691 RepID=UPI001C258EEB|nr:D-arabinono-1,4-lactone oxidase [Streptomyces sp. AC512_CC834]